MTPVNIAWSAGLFEGEGSIEIRKQVRLHLNTTDLDVLEKFAKIVGCGRVREVTAPSVVRPHWKTCWSWNIGREKECRQLLEAWMPHLGERRAKRALQALQLLDEKEVGRDRVCYCGKPFHANVGNQSFCSARCRVEWRQVKLVMA